MVAHLSRILYPGGKSKLEVRGGGGGKILAEEERGEYINLDDRSKAFMKEEKREALMLEVRKILT